MQSEKDQTRNLLSAFRRQLRRCDAQRALIAVMEQGGLSGRKPGGGSGGGFGNPTQGAVLALEREQERLERLELGLVWRRCILRCYLDMVEDPVTRIVLYLRYVDGLTWKQIAVRHGAGASESAMRMLAVRYMDRHPLTGFRLS